MRPNKHQQPNNRLPAPDQLPHAGRLAMLANNLTEPLANIPTPQPDLFPAPWDTLPVRLRQLFILRETAHSYEDLAMLAGHSARNIRTALEYEEQSRGCVFAITPDQAADWRRGLHLAAIDRATINVLRNLHSFSPSEWLRIIARAVDQVNGTKGQRAKPATVNDSGHLGTAIDWQGHTISSGVEDTYQDDAVNM